MINFLYDRRAAFAALAFVAAQSVLPVSPVACAEQPALREVRQAELINSAQADSYVAELRLAQWKLDNLQQLRRAGHASWLELVRCEAAVSELQAHVKSTIAQANFLQTLTREIDAAHECLNDQQRDQAEAPAYAIRLSLPGSVRLICWVEPTYLPQHIARQHLTTSRHLLELDKLPSYALQHAVARKEQAEERLRALSSALASRDAGELRAADMKLAIADAQVRLARANLDDRLAEVAQVVSLEEQLCASGPHIHSESTEGVVSQFPLPCIERLESTVATCAHGARMLISDQRERTKSFLVPHLVGGPAASGDGCGIRQPCASPELSPTRKGDVEPRQVTSALGSPRIQQAEAPTEEASFAATLYKEFISATRDVAEAESAATGDLRAAQIEVQILQQRRQAVQQLRDRAHATQAELDRANEDLMAAQDCARQLRVRQQWFAESLASLPPDSSQPPVPATDAMPARLLTHAPTVRHIIQLQQQWYQAEVQHAVWLDRRRQHDQLCQRLSKASSGDTRARLELKHSLLRRDQMDARVDAAREHMMLLSLELRRFRLQQLYQDQLGGLTPSQPEFDSSALPPFVNSRDMARLINLVAPRHVPTLHTSATSADSVEQGTWPPVIAEWKQLESDQLHSIADLTAAISD